MALITVTTCSISAFYAFDSFRSRRLLHLQCSSSPSCSAEFLSRNTPDFISPLPWPPNSPGLNRLDYVVWGVLQQRVYDNIIRDVDHLIQRLIEEWRCFDRAVRQWRVRLRACVRANGDHFEHKL